MTAQDRTRLWIVRGGVVLGVFGLSLTAMYARGLGPAGRATGGATGCNAGGDIEAARDLVANPELMDFDRAFDPKRFEATGPYTAVDGQLIVALADPEAADDPDLAAAFEELGIVDPILPFLERVPEAGEEASPFDGIFVVRTLRTPREAIARLSELDVVDWAEPVTELEALTRVAEGRPAIGRPLQWNLDVVGEPWMLENTRQGEGATIAVVDSGYLPNRLVDPEFHQTGWDFVDGDAEPVDGFGHGTLVSNLIAEHRDSGGFSGLAPSATLVPLRVLDDAGRGTTLDLAAAVVHASLLDADVILMSLGGYNPSLLVSEAIDFADARGSMLVAAAGNDGLPQLAFPASHPAVISVGSVSPDLEPTKYTNAAVAVDLLAPGGDLTTDIDGDEVADGIVAHQSGKWIAAEGTSLAAAHVAAIAAVAVADGRIEPHLLRREMRAVREDRVVDAQRVVEGARRVRDGAAASGLDGTLVATRLHHGDFRVELSWESELPGTATCTWDEGEAAQPVARAVHRLMLDLRPDLDSRVVCTTTGLDGQVTEQEIVLRPPALAVESADDHCEPIGGDIADPVKIAGKWRGSSGAVCVSQD